MSNNKDPDTELNQSQSINKDHDKAPSEFLIGLVTFIVFIVFMTVWMYFGLKE